MVAVGHKIRDLSILIIDDDPLVQKTISKILKVSNPNYYIESADSVLAAMHLINTTYWDTILLDISLPLKTGDLPDPKNGLMALDQFSQELKLTAPIIAITGFGDDDELSGHVLDKGAYYFLTKPVHAKSLQAIVKNATRSQMSGFDGLTGLLNRVTFEERLKIEFERIKRKNNTPTDNRNNSQLSIIFIDGDNFKEINDSYNHLVGDQVLRKISSCFVDDRLYQVINGTNSEYKYIIRPYDIASRFGGDEFCIFLPETCHCNAFKVAKRINEIIGSMNISEIAGDTPPKYKDRPEKISLSIGLATFPIPNDVETYEDLIKKADDAMYASKETRKGYIFGYDTDGKLIKIDS